MWEFSIFHKILLKCCGDFEANTLMRCLIKIEYIVQYRNCIVKLIKRIMYSLQNK